ncbi:MAG TPA: polysaccharide deacetylase family protein [Solirubrobacteraceae bacterium]|nr:polysaccharide deacetylase family protein [Solirubrobacteraceae bacterium]
MLTDACTLTFDDGPDPEWTPRILAELRRCDARATFFVMGERVQSAPLLARAARMAGHDVELHCHRHIRHTELSEYELELDTVTALRTLAHAGIHPTRWRTPWGVRTDATVRVAARHNLELVDWTIDTHDWRGDSRAVMLQRAQALLEHEAIVLMHDALGPGALRESCRETEALIAPLVRAARALGLQPASLSERDQPRSTAWSSTQPQGAPAPAPAKTRMRRERSLQTIASPRL